MSSSEPSCVLVFSGKRKSGKDHVTNLLQERLGKDKCAILRLSGPLKEQYAKENDLDFSRLLDATDYKEKHRSDMIRWGENKRKQDPAYFCNIITKGPGSELPIWIISDARRKSDVNYFKEHYHKELIVVRVYAEDDVRKERGWTFTLGVDDAESECGLDDHPYDVLINNSEETEQILDNQFENLFHLITEKTLNNKVEYDDKNENRL